MPVSHWDKATPLNNGTVDQLRNLQMQEGIFGPQYNDSIRVLMAELAKWRDDQNGSLLTTGTSTAYVLATNQDFGANPNALADGAHVVARLHTAPGAAATIVVDGHAAKPLRIASATALVVATVLAGRPVGLRWSAADDCWYIVFRSIEPASAAEARAQSLDSKALTPKSMESILPIGTKTAFYQAAAPAGWTQITDAAINDAIIRFTNGAGGGTNGGSAAFGTVFTSRTPAGTVGGTALTEANMAAHRHAVVANAASSAGVGLSGSNFLSVEVTAGMGDSNYSLRGAGTEPGVGLSSVSGSGTSHNHTFIGTAMDFAVKHCNFIICERTAA